MTSTLPSQTRRCRLVLIASQPIVAACDVAALHSALAGGDVASIIVPSHDLDEARYQAVLGQFVEVGQAAGAAVVAVDDSRAAGRCRADGLHITGSLDELIDAVGKADGRSIVGCGYADTRDAALQAGSAQPDYLFFGRIGKDLRPEPHKRNVALATWWAEMVEIPCIIMGGNALDTLPLAAGTGAEFVALSSAVFNEGVDPEDAVRQANAVLENFRLEEAA